MPILRRPSRTLLFGIIIRKAVGFFVRYIPYANKGLNSYASPEASPSSSCPHGVSLIPGSISGGVPAFIHPFAPEVGNALPADITTACWLRMSRRQVGGFLSAQQSANYNVMVDSDAEPGWNDIEKQVALLRRYYDISIRERDSRMVVFWGLRLLSGLRNLIPDMHTPSLDEPLNIQAHLSALGYHFEDDSEAVDVQAPLDSHVQSDLNASEHQQSLDVIVNRQLR